jgi:enoyl-CoA hydratase/carnithine racemase
MKELYNQKQLRATLDSAGVCRVTLVNPTQLNALNTTMAEGCIELVSIILASDARVVVFTGEGRAFSAGGDLEYLLELTKIPAEESQAAMLRFYESYLKLFTLDLPTIAHLNGACVGAGFCLALACDMRFVVSDAKIGMNFVRIGLNPGMAAEYWATKIQTNLAREMLLSGKIYSSSEPRVRSLFNQVASPQEIARSVEITANEIAANSPQSVRMSVGLLRQQNPTLQGIMNDESQGQGICMSTGQIAEAVASQKDRRPFRFRT